ncbi:hypothetical protein D7Y41_32945 [Anaerotruncus sp. 1XD22-93]|nr:hypothetical protein [Anaerotruncus sp. 1XD42-93]RKJ75609.1 hypothetical protein D7Y41_32945 [Anaerotruncus sp. 1XD22-93]
MCAFYLAFCTSKKQAVRPDGTGHPGAACGTLLKKGKVLHRCTSPTIVWGRGGSIRGFPLMCAFYLAFCTSKKQAVRPDGTGHPLPPEGGILNLRRQGTAQLYIFS